MVRQAKPEKTYLAEASSSRQHGDKYTDVQDHVTNALAARTTASPFYQSKCFQKIAYCSRKAKIAEYDKAVNANLRMVDAHIGRKK
jgi:hypothetical protein